MIQRIVIILVCMGLLGVGVTMLSASPSSRNIFRAASDPGSRAKPCPDESPTQGAPKSSAAGFMIAGTEFQGAFDAEMSGVCQGSCAARQPYEAGEIVAQPGAEDGDLARCPVSGVVFAVASDHPQIAVGDDAYRFCCDGCAEKFRAEPARFVRL